MIMEAEADAEAEILRGEAKAFAIEARAKAEAEQVRVVRVFINYGVTCNLQSECFISVQNTIYSSVAFNFPSLIFTLLCSFRLV